MGRDASVTLAWADGNYTFRLAWGELIELQEQCDAGPYVVLGRLSQGAWKMQDISETLRLGLIGGGVEPAKALTLVETYVKPRPPMENLQFARGVLSLALLGPPPEKNGEPGEKPGEAEAAPETTSD